jgi:CHAT domain-containing protein
MTRLGGTAAITEAAEAFAKALKGFGSTELLVRQHAASRLSALIFDSLSASVAGKRKLIFAPDRILHYIPFAALQTMEGNRYLVESYEIATTRSIRSLLDPDARPRATPEPDGFLLVADPVYSVDDERFSIRSSRAANAQVEPSIWSQLLRRGQRLTRLAGSARELAGIEALVPPNHAQVLEGFAASKQRFLSSRLEQYRVIHVASHATTDAEIPGLSALILSTFDESGAEIDGRVLAADLAAHRINAALVVLSGCDTALGKDIAGEGLMGLQYIVQARGARSVISSLWELPDDAAAQTMKAFYQAYLGRSLPVASALSEAMRQMLKGRFKDPGEWAAFNASVSDIGPVR